MSPGVLSSSTSTTRLHLHMLLTLVGIFSMTAYAVARRTQEIGIRMAIR